MPDETTAADATGLTLTDLDREDVKILKLAQVALVRARSLEGAAVRDTTGRTYLGCTVALPSLPLTALQAAVAAAVTSGATGLEAAAVVSEIGGGVDPASLAAVRELGPGATVLLADRYGQLTEVLRAEQPPPPPAEQPPPS